MSKNDIFEKDRKSSLASAILCQKSLNVNFKFNYQLLMISIFDMYYIFSFFDMLAHLWWALISNIFLSLFAPPPPLAHSVKTLSMRNTIGDSTFSEFRNEFADQLRKCGYDLRLWWAKAGAWEEEAAVRVVTSPTVNLNIVCPNGNRLSQQREARQPAWLDQTCGKLAAAIKASSAEAVVFVGDASG